MRSLRKITVMSMFLRKSKFIVCNASWYLPQAVFFKQQRQTQFESKVHNSKQYGISKGISLWVELGCGLKRFEKNVMFESTGVQRYIRLAIRARYLYVNRVFVHKNPITKMHSYKPPMSPPNCTTS